MDKIILLKPYPIEKWPGISFSTRRNMRVTGHIGERITTTQDDSQGGQHLILPVGERRLIAAFQFYADRKIVATFTAAKCRQPSMPRPIVGRNELQQAAITLNHEMRRYSQGTQLVEIRMDIAIELIAKQRADERAAKLSWRQADAVN